MKGTNLILEKQINPTSALSQFNGNAAYQSVSANKIQITSSGQGTNKLQVTFSAVSPSSMGGKDTVLNPPGPTIIYNNGQHAHSSPVAPVNASPNQKRSSSYEVHLQGALEKQGRLKPWSWKKYWFLLSDEHLCYYKNNKKDLSSHRTIDLGKAENVFRQAQTSRGFPLEIITKSRRHVLVAPTSESCEQWVNAIYKAIVIGHKKHYALSRASCDSISDDDTIGLSNGNRASISSTARGSMSSSSTSTNTPSTPDTPPTLWTVSSLHESMSSDLTLTRAYVEDKGREVQFNGGPRRTLADKNCETHDQLSLMDSFDDSQKMPLKRLTRGIHLKHAVRPSYVNTCDNPSMDDSLCENQSIDDSPCEDQSNDDSPSPNRTKGLSFQKSYIEHASESGSDLDSDVFLHDKGYTSSHNSHEVKEDLYGDKCSNNESETTVQTFAEKKDNMIETEKKDSRIKIDKNNCVVSSQSCASIGQLTSDYCSENESVGTVAGSNEQVNWTLLDMLVAVTNSSRLDFKSRYSPIFKLPHPRLEMTWDSPFDGIRVFLAQTRDPTEVYSVQRRRSDKRGFAIAQLRELLRLLDGVDEEVLCCTRL